MKYNNLLLLLNSYIQMVLQALDYISILQVGTCEETLQK